jgi:hypothetical protein
MVPSIEYLSLLAVAVLIGKVVFLSFVVAPMLAKALDREAFGLVVRRLFPAYYGLGMAGFCCRHCLCARAGNCSGDECNAVPHGMHVAGDFGCRDLLPIAAYPSEQCHEGSIESAGSPCGC